MADYIDPIHFNDLDRLDPETVCRRTASTYDPVQQRYTLSVWGRTYRITPGAQRLEKLAPDPERDHGFLGLFVLHYLLAERAITPDSSWISEKEIPGGATFFRGPHAIATHRIADRFDNDLAAFRERCQALGGQPLALADAAYRFEIVPQVPVAVLYWCGDAEFPAEAKLLFDRSIGRYLAADVVYALAMGICERLGR
ncbi:MAG: DUF3786 domain-containing protein [Desulfosarcinaceae bacterium]|nr:DUF3786 domain-containing protein [Desulfosarcinaceae bacterium]